NVGGGHRVGVDDRVRIEVPDRPGMTVQGVPIGVEVAHRQPRRRFVLTAVHDQDVVAALVEPFVDPPSDEPGAAEDDRSHLTILAQIRAEGQTPAAAPVGDARVVSAPTEGPPDRRRRTSPSPAQASAWNEPGGSGPRRWANDAPQATVRSRKSG